MKTRALLIYAAALLGLAFLVHLMNPLVSDRGMDTALLESYIDAGNEGDLARLSELGDSAKIANEVQVLGTAQHDYVARALNRTMAKGAKQAALARSRFMGDLKSDASAAYRTERPQDVDRRTWINQRAYAGLSPTEQTLVTLNEDNKAVYVWTEVEAKGLRPWRNLRWSARKKLKQEDYLAEKGAAYTSAATQEILLKAGAFEAGEADKAYANLETLNAWRNKSAFVQSNGDEQTVKMYKDYYAQPKVVDLSVEHAPAEGRLFQTGRSQLHAELASGSGTAAFMVRDENGWNIQTVEDVSVVRTAQTLCSADVIENEKQMDNYPREEADAAQREYPIENNDTPEVMYAAFPEMECTWDDAYQQPLTRVSDHSVSAAGTDSSEIESYMFGMGVLICLIILIVMFRSGRNFDEIKVDILDDEVHIDTIDRSILGFKGKLTLTNKRLVFRYVTWFLALARTDHIPLSSVKLVSLRHGMRVLWLALAILMVPIVTPIALLITIYALAASKLKLVFRLGLSFWSRRKTFSLYGSQTALVDGTRFLRNTLRHAGGSQGGAMGSSDVALPALGEQRGSLDQSILPKLLTIMAVVFIERLFFGEVNFEDWLLLAPFMAIPVLSGIKQGPANGGVIGLFSGLGLLSMLQPMPTNGLLSAGAGLDTTGMLVVIAALGLSGVAAGWANIIWERPRSNELLTQLSYGAGLFVIFLIWYMIPDYLESASAGTMTWFTSCAGALGVVLLWMGRDGIQMPTALAGAIAGKGAVTEPTPPSSPPAPVDEDTDDEDTQNDELDLSDDLVSIDEPK
jgi:hypothetical protein